MSRLLLCLVLLVLPLSGNAQLSYQELASLTDAPGQLQGRFTQDKYLQEVDAHLESSGLFSYRRGEEILWETLEPIHSKLILSPSAIVSQQDGRQLINLDGESNPVVGMLSRIFFAVFSADWERLEEYFSLSGTRSDDSWEAQLIPLEPAIRQRIGRIELRGDRLLREVMLHENGGDYTRIRFHEPDR